MEDVLAGLFEGLVVEFSFYDVAGRVCGTRSHVKHR